jgi:hypothetical protein
MGSQRRKQEDEENLQETSDHNIFA